MTFLKTATAVSALLLMASAASASTILIDDFTTDGSVNSNGGSNGGNPDAAPFAGGSILGGERFMWVSSDDQPAPNNGTSFEATGAVPGGVLNFSNGSSAGGAFTGTGQAVLVYDGDAPKTALSNREEFFFNDVPTGLIGNADFPTAQSAAIPVDTDGLADLSGVGIDFLDGFDISQRGIEFEFASFDPGGQLDFRAYLWDTNDNLVTFQELLINNSGLPTDVNFDTVLGLDELVGPNADTFNFESIGAVAFSVESLTPEFDGTLLSISVVPLPASALLLLGGLGGLAGVSSMSKRRRKNSAA